MKYPNIEVDIFESESYPVVMHVFYGETIEEARGYFKAHMKTDSFLRESVHKGRYKGMKVKVQISESKG